MFGSMFIGLSGMNAYSNGLRQVSNNITNLNSTGYRASTVGFNDLFAGGSTAVSYSSGGSRGGDGVRLSDLRLDFSQGELRQSENELDLAVDGNGFLVLEDGGNYTYARTGSFEVNQDGHIVLSGTDYKLTVLDGSGRPQSITIDSYRTSEPSATTTIRFADNLSSTATDFSLADVRVYNADGEESTWQLDFLRDQDTAGSWAVTVTDQNGDIVGEQTLNFVGGAPTAETERLLFTDEENGLSIELDFSEGVTSFSSGEISTMRTSEVDGYGIGDIASIRVNEEGALEIGYTNEETRDLGQISLADFREPQNLEQRSGGLFTYDSATGREIYGSNSDRVGRVLSNRIESSNVDLSKEFGDLILVQRGYQASSQIVSVSNDMIQQLFGIRGQG